MGQACLRCNQSLGSASAHLSVPAAPQALKTGDGHVIVGAANQPSWEKFAHTIDAAPLLEDERFADNPGRVSNLDTLVRLPAAPAGWLWSAV